MILYTCPCGGSSEDTTVCPSCGRRMERTTLEVPRSKPAANKPASREWVANQIRLLREQWATNA